ncbi:RES domain-containing protein [Pseudomonas sp. Marseille-Q5299]|uniref:RES domain-containing protein n=1 Tax=Pseudomonas sp. Marseille-Q5299 TaxID=2942201 RepID=UPI002072B90D|nr:RES domain-containing protein [Pseudomonas sp. Marseille-Q5299]
MICTECVYLIPLKKLITTQGAFGHCDYCRAPGMCLLDTAVFEYIGNRIKESYRVIEELSSRERGMFFHGSEKIPMVEYWQILQDDFNIGVDDFTDNAINHLEEELAHDENGQAQLWALDDGSLESNSYEDEWNKFASDINHGYRYFNDGARRFLDSLFKFTCENGKLKKELITTLSESDELYRARKISGVDAWKAFEDAPWAALGPAPAAMAGDQRMTPSGISAMYCALDRETCLSEIRSITGDTVISGAFKPVTTVSLLNLRKLEEMARFEEHPFDIGYARASHAYEFLKRLIFKLSKPRSSSDTLGYLSTQVVFEYLRIKFKDQVSGIIFPSVQTGLKGTNTVIFPERALTASHEYDINMEDPLGHAPFARPIPLLKFSKGSLVVHQIKAVRTESKDYNDILDYVYDNL